MKYIVPNDCDVLLQKKWLELEQAGDCISENKASVICCHKCTTSEKNRNYLVCLVWSKNLIRKKFHIVENDHISSFLPLFFKKGNSLHSSGWPRTHCVDRAVLNLQESSPVCLSQCKKQMNWKKKYTRKLKKFWIN